MRHRSLISTFFPYTTLFRSLSNKLPQNPLSFPMSAIRLIIITLVFFGSRQVGAQFSYENEIYVTGDVVEDRKSTRLNSSHLVISYAVFCLKKKRMIEKRKYI